MRGTDFFMNSVRIKLLISNRFFIIIINQTRKNYALALILLKKYVKSK